MEKLMPLKYLIKESFSMYVEKFWLFVKLVLLNLLIFLPALLFAALFFARGGFLLFAMFLIIFLLFIACIAVILFLVKVALVVAVKDRGQNPSAKYYLKSAWNYLGSYAFITLLVGLCVLGGTILLIVPGVIFAIWFMFSGYVFVSEGIKGKLALRRSRELVTGYWWAVFGRMALLVVASLIISYIPLVGSIANLFFTMPFSVIYGYSIYEDLKRVRSLPAKI